MKKLALLALAGITIASCKTEPTKDYMIFSGKIDNLDKKEIQLRGYEFNDKVKVNTDGTFSDTLKLNDGYYSFYDGKKSIDLYLNKVKDLNVTYDLKDSTNTITFTGKNASINTYLLKKGKQTKKTLGSTKDLYSLEETHFLAKLNKAKDDAKRLVESSNFDNSLKQIELKNIDYNYANNLNRYASYHAYFAKKKDFKASETFPNPTKGMDLNNEDDYKNSSAYRSIVGSNYSKLAADKSEKDDSDYSLNYMIFVKEKATNKNIADKLLYDNAKYGITYTEQLQEFYKKFMEYSSNEENKKEITKTYNKLKVTAKGQPSPKFVNYENFKGGTTSLDDLKGKYVYVDVWATWCGPCKKEIPSLKKVEKQYHGKNIEFVSMSVDSKKDHDAWKKMVKEKELGGIQLFADKSWDSKFVKDYVIQGIPRFILINPEGKIVTANAPRPSSKKLIKLFDKLKI